MQKLVGEAEGLAGEEAAGGVGANLGRDGENGGGRERGKGWTHERDVREDDEYLFDEGRVNGRELSLFGALEEADRRHRESVGVGGARGAGEAGGGVGGGVEMAVCPVCGEFEGDERAVAFHVEGHFAEG